MKNIAYDGKLQLRGQSRLSRAERRRMSLANGGVSGALSSVGPSIELSCPLLFKLRPLTIADMAPGYAYEPGLTILTVMTWPVFGDDNRSGVGYDFPIRLPEKYREPTEENTLIALNLLCAIDPEAAVLVDRLKHLARQPQSRAFANTPAAEAFLTSLRSSS